MSIIVTELSSVRVQLNAQATQIQEQELKLQEQEYRFLELDSAEAQAQSNQEVSSPLKKKAKPTNPTAPTIPTAPALSDTAKTYQANLAVLYIKHVITGDETQDHYAPPTLSQQAMTLIQATENLPFQTAWRRMHTAAKDKVKNSHYALLTLASQNFIASLPLAKKMLSGIFYSQPLGRLRFQDTWKYELALAHFATPADNNQHQDFIRQEREELNSDLHYSTDSVHATKRDLSLFLQGHFDSTIDNILQCVANFIVLSGSLVHIPSPMKLHAKNPLIINMLVEMATLLINEDAKSTITFVAKSYPHVLFTIFGYFQDILAQFGRILSTNEVTGIIQAAPSFSQIRLDESHFIEIHAIFDQNMQDLKKILTQGTAPTHAPKSYSLFHSPAVTTTSITTVAEKPSKETDKLDSSASRKLTQAITQLQHSISQGNPPKGSIRDSKPTSGKGDWLEMSAGVSHKEFLKFPKGIFFCLHHAIKGMTCGMPRCQFKHLAYADLTTDQQKILETHLNEKNQPAMKFKICP